jgi:SOS response regulatory protein OraA/RecX
MQIERAGIAKAVARHAIDEVFGAIDDDALLEASLNRRLRGRTTIADDREMQRLYRYLVAQGFESDRALRRLHQLRRNA